MRNVIIAMIGLNALMLSPVHADTFTDQEVLAVVSENYGPYDTAYGPFAAETATETLLSTTSEYTLSAVYGPEEPHTVEMIVDTAELAALTEVHTVEAPAEEPVAVETAEVHTVEAPADLFADASSDNELANETETAALSDDQLGNERGASGMIAISDVNITSEGNSANNVRMNSSNTIGAGAYSNNVGITPSVVVNGMYNNVAQSTTVNLTINQAPVQ